MEGKDSLWTLESPTRTSRMENQNALIATNMDTWQKNADQRRKNEKQGNVSNMTRKGI